MLAKLTMEEKKEKRVKEKFKDLKTSIQQRQVELPGKSKSRKAHNAECVSPWQMTNNNKI